MVKHKSLSRSPHAGWTPVSEMVGRNATGNNNDLPPLTDMSIFIKTGLDSSTGGATLNVLNKKSIPDSGATNGRLLKDNSNYGSRSQTSFNSKKTKSISPKPTTTVKETNQVVRQRKPGVPTMASL